MIPVLVRRFFIGERGKTRAAAPFQWAGEA
jgi:hypothetical protein